MRSLPTVAEPVAAAIAEREAGDLLGALTRLERLISERPEDAGAHLEAGRTLLQLNLPAHAARRLDRASALDAEQQGLEIERGRAAARRGRLEEARGHFEQAAAAAPTTRAVVELARTVRLLGEPAAAVRLLPGRADDDASEDEAAELLEERALSLVSLGDLDDAVPILDELVSSGRRADSVWRAALVLTARREFDEALRLFGLFDASARLHARDLVFYFRRGESIRVAKAAYERAGRNPRLALVDLRPFLADDEHPLDAVDLERVSQTHPTKSFLLDSPQDDETYRSSVSALQARLGERADVPYRFARPICFQYLVPGARVIRNGAQYSVVGRDGSFVPELVPDERFSAAVARFAAFRRKPETDPLELAFVTPLFGWRNHFQTLVHVLSTLAVYRRLGLTCPIVLPGPPSALQSDVIAASGVGARTPILAAEDVVGTSIRLAVCPAPEGSGRLLREWAQGVLEHVADGAGRAPTGDGVLYISRRGSTRRPLVNEDALEERLRDAWGAAVVRMEGLTFREQVAAVRSARTIVAPHGAGLTNLLFAADDAVVVELIPDRYPNTNFARLAANARRLYVALTGTVEDARSADDLRWRIDVAKVEALLERIVLTP